MKRWNILLGFGLFVRLRRLSDSKAKLWTLYSPCTSPWSTYSTADTYTKIGTIQRRLAWPLRKDDTQNREAFLIFALFFDTRVSHYVPAHSLSHHLLKTISHYYRQDGRPVQGARLKHHMLVIVPTMIWSILVFVRRRGFKSHFWQILFLSVSRHLSVILSWQQNLYENCINSFFTREPGIPNRFSKDEMFDCVGRTDQGLPLTGAIPLLTDTAALSCWVSPPDSFHCSLDNLDPGDSSSRPMSMPISVRTPVPRSHPLAR